MGEATGAFSCAESLRSKLNELDSIEFAWAREDSNLHGLIAHWVLNPARLPIPPLARVGPERLQPPCSGGQMDMVCGHGEDTRRLPGGARRGARSCRTVRRTAAESSAGVSRVDRVCQASAHQGQQDRQGGRSDHGDGDRAVAGRTPAADQRSGTMRSTCPSNVTTIISPLASVPMPLIWLISPRSDRQSTSFVTSPSTSRKLLIHPRHQSA